MTMVKGIFVLIIVLTSFVLATACSCFEQAYEQPFLTIVPDSGSCCSVQVLEYEGKRRSHDLAMRVKIIETLKGGIDGTMLIWGDDGHLCRPYVNTFPLKSEWVFAINYIREDEGTGDFVLSNCGHYWLRVQKDRAYGHIDKPGVESEMTLESLKKNIQSAPNNSLNRTHPRALATARSLRWAG